MIYLWYEDDIIIAEDVSRNSLLRDSSQETQDAEDF